MTSNLYVYPISPSARIVYQPPNIHLPRDVPQDLTPHRFNSHSLSLTTTTLLSPVFLAFECYTCEKCGSQPTSLSHWFPTFNSLSQHLTWHAPPGKEQRWTEGVLCWWFEETTTPLSTCTPRVARRTWTRSLHWIWLLCPNQQGHPQGGLRAVRKSLILPSSSRWPSSLNPLLHKAHCPSAPSPSFLPPLLAHSPVEPPGSRTPSLSLSLAGPAACWTRLWVWMELTFEYLERAAPLIAAPRTHRFKGSTSPWMEGGTREGWGEALRQSRSSGPVGWTSFSWSILLKCPGFTALKWVP